MLEMIFIIILECLLTFQLFHKLCSSLFIQAFQTSELALFDFLIRLPLNPVECFLPNAFPYNSSEKAEALDLVYSDHRVHFSLKLSLIVSSHYVCWRFPHASLVLGTPKNCFHHESHLTLEN